MGGDHRAEGPYSGEERCCADVAEVRGGKSV